MSFPNSFAVNDTRPLCGRYVKRARVCVICVYVVCVCVVCACSIINRRTHIICSLPPNQVNGWGFKRITEGPDLNSYYHEMFLRGLPQVCGKMRRPQKGQGAHAAHNKDSSGSLGQAPDFYKISMFAPLPPLEDEEAKPLSSTPSPEQQQQQKSPKTPDRPVKPSLSSNGEPDVNSSSAVTNDSPVSTSNNHHQHHKDRAKIADTDSKDSADNIDDDDEEEEEEDAEDDITDDNNHKPKVTPTRPEPKAPPPTTPKLYMTNSPDYALSRAPPSPDGVGGDGVHGVLIDHHHHHQQQQYHGSTLSPTDMGREFVELPTSAGNSVTSWTNSPSEEDLMFGGGLSLANAFSPHSGLNNNMMHNSSGDPHNNMLHLHQQQQQQQHPYYNHHPHHMHPAMLQHHLHRGGGGRRPSPPLPSFPPSDNDRVGGMGTRALMPRSFDGMPPAGDSGGDGLSEADLSYLTFQNRILLSQATTRSPDGGGPAAVNNNKNNNHNNKSSKSS
jgi:hypothetical protein